MPVPKSTVAGLMNMINKTRKNVTMANKAANQTVTAAKKVLTRGEGSRTLVTAKAGGKRRGRKAGRKTRKSKSTRRR